MHQIEQEVRQFVIENLVFGSEGDSLCAEDSFLENGLIDSMGILNLVSFVEGKYGLRVEDEELIPENWDSIRRIAMLIEAKVKSMAATEAPAIAH